MFVERCAMSLRETTDAAKAAAHRILDMAKAGQPIDPSQVDWALVILGDYADLIQDEYD